MSILIPRQADLRSLTFGRKAKLTVLEPGSMVHASYFTNKESQVAIYRVTSWGMLPRTFFPETLATLWKSPMRRTIKFWGHGSERLRYGGNLGIIKYPEKMR